MERLQKLLARAGVASRRASERLILEGRVTVDGRVVSELGAKADPTTSVVAVDGRPLAWPDAPQALMLNKPAGVLTTRHDERGRRTVMDFVPVELRSLVFPVGRLDLNSTGLVLLTNDGPLAFRLTHPSYHVPKTYEVTTDRPLTDAELRRLVRGVIIEDGAPARADINRSGTDGCSFVFVLHEGRKRQIRRMLRAVGAHAVRLHRVAIGPLQLGDLPFGQTRSLTPTELSALRTAVGLEP